MSAPLSLPQSSTGKLFSIGSLSTATGISPDTLRIWERRYGEPEPIRLPSGHRRYTQEHVTRIRRVAEALALGMRPGSILGRAPEVLERLLVEARAQTKLTPDHERWLQLIQEHRTKELLAEFLERGRSLDAETLFDDWLSPVLHEVGARWAAGDLEVRHEHMSSEVLEDGIRMLRQESLRRRESPYGMRVLLASLPGEHHHLGLQMAALICEEANVEAIILGPDTPVADIAEAATSVRAHAVGVSISLANAGASADRVLVRLRDTLQEGIQLVVGGEGTLTGRRGPRGIRFFRRLGDFRKWLEGLANSATAQAS